MFANIEKTIKIIAKVIWWFGTITIVGILTFWPVAFILYGFAELIENQKLLVKTIKTNQILEKNNFSSNNYNRPNVNTNNSLPKI